MKRIVAATIAITLAIVAFVTQPIVEEPFVDIGEPLVIYAQKPVTPTPIEHFRPRPVLSALELARFRAEVGLVWRWSLRQELAFIEEAKAKPEPKSMASSPRKSRVAHPIAPADLADLVGKYFAPEDVQQALAVVWCESGYDANAKNPRSTASGLFQHLKGWWSGAWGVTGAFDPFDPESSVKAAAALAYKTSSGWDNWAPSRSCWG